MDHEIAALAGRQRGLATLQQMTGLGLSAGAVHERCAAGRLHRVHRGVYAVGHRALTPLALLQAALLAFGPRALLSHLSAAWLWGLLERRRSEIDVTVPSGRPRSGVRVHRSDIARFDRSMRHGLACTSFERTLVDLASCLSPRELEHAVERAEISRRLDHDALRRAIDGAAGRRGVARLRSIMDELDEPAATRSHAERRLLRALAAAGIARPQVNAWVELPGGGVEVDMLWPAERLVVEVNGWQFHGNRIAYEADPVRIERLQRAAFTTRTFTGRRVHRDAAGVAATIAAALGMSAS